MKFAIQNEIDNCVKRIEIVEKNKNTKKETNNENKSIF